MVGDHIDVKGCNTNTISSNYLSVSIVLKPAISFVQNTQAVRKRQQNWTDRVQIGEIMV